MYRVLAKGAQKETLDAMALAKSIRIFKGSLSGSETTSTPSISMIDILRLRL